MEPVGWKPEMRRARGAPAALDDAALDDALDVDAVAAGAVRRAFVVIVVMSMLLDSADRPIERPDMRLAHENGRPDRTAA